MKTHKHLILTAYTSNPPKSPRYIRRYLRQLVKLADMKIFMRPQARYCRDPENSGVTGTVVITTSHSSVHVWDNGLVQADLYSCKDFNEADIVDFMVRAFSLELFAFEVINRSPDVLDSLRLKPV